ncbi:M20 family peptidase [Paraglaciecola polaris]|uniref:Carboxypeptidase PM20D1 n=1 Tax=Paraglaciecola polaris LMG 21857 TaxID=1129793 RepID=K6YEN9_9ALTE|nr:M20 family peptidase [Paraglaciecola polaris]GAC31209.1 carboxypeptidase PM20D1 [Paraglaciecola polaris LMG 21857]
MKKIIIAFAVVILVLIGLLFYRANSFYSDQQYVVESPITTVNIDTQAALERFSQAIQIPTISYDDRSQFDQKAFLAFQQYMKTSFPLVHQKTSLDVINGYSLLYHLKGSDSTLKPALFMGHMDVVPVDEATAEQWQQPPFSGKVIDGVIWGRGTIDDKISVVALMESMEMLLAQNIQPKRSIYFAFGHDEEAGGKDGAKQIAAFLAKKNITFEFVLDEGGVVTQDMLPGVAEPVAVIGIAEKGFVNLRLTVNAPGGHSSQPPAHTAAGILAQAIVKVEANPFTTDMRFIQNTFKHIGFATDLATRLPMSNLWLFSPAVESMMLKSPSSAASIRTSTAVTMLKGSSKSNILPTQAEAVVNFRILPGDTIQSVTQHITKAIGNPNVKIEAFMTNEASPVSSTETYGYQLIEQTIRRLDQNLLVAPYLVQGGTDASNFYGLSDNVYRFMMVRLNPQTMKRFHGVNEQIAVEDYMQAIQFYYAMVKQAGEG